MIDYIDPVVPVVLFLSDRLTGINVCGNTIYQGVSLPALLVKNAGGQGFSRIQLLCRSDDDIDAMQKLMEAMNLLERSAAQIGGLRVIWCSRESNPIPSVDTDTNKPEAWCYMRLEHIEA